MAFLPDWLTGYDADNAARAQAAHDRLQQMNAAKYGPLYTPKDTQSYDPDEQRAEIDQVFTDSVKGDINRIGEKILGVFKLLPWWVYVVAGVALFFYLGGAAVIRKQVSKLA